MLIEGIDPEIINFIKDNLIDVEDEDLALATIRQGVPKELWLETLEEWKRITGGTLKRED
jgi:hypothetical protein